MKAKEKKSLADPVELQKKKMKRKSFWKNQLAPTFFIGPHLFFFLVFFIFPFIYGIYIAFTKWDMVSSPVWVGFDNFKLIFTPGEPAHEAFINGLKATLTYTVVMVPLIVIVPLMLALWLYNIKHKRARAIFQAVLYAPSLLSVATVVLIWRWLLTQDAGLVNNLLQADLDWSKQPYAWIAIFVLTLWSGVGGNMIIFMSGLSGIPKSYYEAARIDGADGWQQFFRITLPSLRFQLLYATVMATIGGFNVYGQPAMYGGDGETTTTIMMYIQNYAFPSEGGPSQAGIASAMSVLLGLIIAVFSVIQFRMMSRKEE